MEYFPCLCSRPLGWAGSRVTALLRPPQPQQPLSPTVKNTPGSQEGTSHCKKGRGELFSVPSLQQEQLEAWDLLVEIHSNCSLALIAQGGLG